LLDPDFNRYMDIQQAINLGIIQKFQEEGVAFAYPTRTISLADGRRDGEISALHRTSPLRAGMRHVMQDG
jgi:small-conductance mechanosensitive channel